MVLEKRASQFNVFADQYITPPIKILADDIETLAHAVNGAGTCFLSRLYDMG